jgi:hypothetical protein
MPTTPEFKIISVRFEVTVQTARPRFSVPPEVVQFLGNGGLFHFRIESMTGEVLFDGDRPLRSAVEVYWGAALAQALVPGHRIRVEVSAELPT